MTPQEPKPRNAFISVLTLLGGAVLPAISIGVEATTHMCAETFFDPIPTVWHLLLVILVPLANFQLWLAVHRNRPERAALLGLANALACGISLFYTLVYLPLTPLAVIAIIFYGMGLLPLTPLLSLIAGLILRRQLRQIAPAGLTLSLKGLGLGLAATVVALILIELPATLTRAGLQMATSESITQRQRGLRWLRAVGQRDYLLRACYQRSGMATDLVSFIFSLDDPVSPDEARAVYYRLYGETFNTAVPPRRLGGRWEPQETFDFDPDQGGTVIAGKIKNLSLAHSRLDGSVDADAGLGYLEWTLVFRNNSRGQQEARAQVQLPPGGVVSRLTLWVNGEEREAAFAGKRRVQEAYQAVVNQRRDPVLVTTAGDDRVLVQCFPVPADGGEMKIRFGVTFPLLLNEPTQGLLRLPYFVDRNFGIAENIGHAVWIEAKTALHADNKNLLAEQPAPNLYAVRGTVPDAELSAHGATLRADRNGDAVAAWTPDSIQGGRHVVRQTIRKNDAPPVEQLVLIVDTSHKMKDSLLQIATALRSLPPDITVQLVLAAAEEQSFDAPIFSGSPEEAARQLSKVEAEGGADNVPALARGWDAAAARPRSLLLWIHGPQPIVLNDLSELEQRWDRRPAGVVLYALQAENGPNRVRAGLDGHGRVVSVPRLGDVQGDIGDLLARAINQKDEWEFERVGAEPGRSGQSAGKETSAHLARLWAHDEVRRLVEVPEQGGFDEAVQVAARYQLVTPVSGAVVLETAEQYERAGLTPVEPGSVPTIPEPETILLVAVVVLILLWSLRRQWFARRRTA